MSQEKNNTQRKKFKHSEIGESLDFSKRTINRDIKRGMVYGLKNSNRSIRNEYVPDKAQAGRKEKASNKGPALKIGKCLALSNHLENEIIKQKRLPYATLKDLKKSKLSFKISICEKTLYNYIHAKLFFQLESKHLPYKKKKKKNGFKARIADNNRKGTSIEERDPKVLLRDEYGHWEIDCVVGKRNDGGSVLLTLIERKTRKFIVRKIKSKTQESVTRELNQIEKEYGTSKFKTMFKTITADNGVEFLDQKNMEKSDLKTGEKTNIYYCYAYCSWERGSNENANKLIRRWIPKGTNITKYSKREIKKIENWINNYPRKLFDGSTSIEKEDEF